MKALPPLRFTSLRWSFLFFLPLIVIYWLTGPTTLPEADAGEFAAIAVSGGIAHPPGYPLLTLFLRAFALLGPWLGLIRALSLFSMLCHYFAAIFLYRTLLYVRNNPFAALVATYVVFLSVDVWRAGTIFEPFALNILQACIILYCFSRLLLSELNLRAMIPLLFVIGLMFGFGVCNHHSLALLVPIPVALAVNYYRKWYVVLPVMAVGFVVGLLPLSYFFVGHPADALVWGDWGRPWERLWVHLLRKEYGTTSLMPSRQGSWTFGPFLFLRTLPGTLNVVFLFFLFAGIERVITTHVDVKRNCTPVVYWSILAVCFLLLALVFPSMFQIPDTLFSTMIARRFFALPLILCAFPIFEGILSQRIFVRPFCSPAILCGLVLIHATLNSAPSSRHDDTFFEKHVRNVFSVIEPNAVLLTGNDADFMVAQYGKYVLGFTNVDDIAFGIQSINWYRKMMKPRFDIPDTLFSGPIIELIQALIKKKPVYLLSYPHDEPKTKSLLKKSFPVGPCIKIIDDNDTLPYPREIFIMNMKLFQNNLELPSRADVTYYSPWNYSSLGYYYRTWNSIGSALKKMGDETLSQRAFTYRDAFDINDGN